MLQQALIETTPSPERQSTVVGKVIINLSYLRQADLSAGVQEVLYVSPTLGHAEFGLEVQKGTQSRSRVAGHLKYSSQGSKVGTHTHHRRGWNVDAADGARADVIGQVAEDDAVHQRRPEVLGEDDLQPALDALRKDRTLEAGV